MNIHDELNLVLHSHQLFASDAIFRYAFHGYFMDFSWIFHGFFMVYHWYINGSIFYTEGDSYLGRAKAQHRAAGAGQKGAAGGLPGGFPMGITCKNLGKSWETHGENRRFLCRMYH